MKAWSERQLRDEQHASGHAYLELLRETSMSAGLYVLQAGTRDGQSPHTEDEIYVVLSGRGRFTSGDATRDVAPGEVIYVPAHLPHRFHQIVEDLHLAVIFAPPESSAAVEKETV